MRSSFAFPDVPTPLSTFAFVDLGWSVICKIYNQELWCRTDVWCQHSAIQDTSLSPSRMRCCFSLLTAHFVIIRPTSVPWASFTEENFKSALLLSWNLIWYNIFSFTRLSCWGKKKKELALHASKIQSCLRFSSKWLQHTKYWRAFVWM